VIYDPGPQSGGRSPAPGRLGLVQAFVNSHFDLRPGRDRGADRFRSPEGLGGWLRERELLAPAAPAPSVADTSRAIAVREGLRALLAAHNHGDGDPVALAELEASTRGLRAGVELGPGGRARPYPVTADAAGALGLVVAVVAEAQAAGTWRRLKACPGDHCGWAFYDRSRNGTSSWCSMAVCGGRAKARAYRRRSRGGQA
jgi:predicted RNA-binding Zn ribbon-like protein